MRAMAIRRLGLSHVAIVMVMLIAGLLLTHQSVEAQSTSTLRFVCADKLGQLHVVGNSNSCPSGYYRFLLGPNNPALTVCLTPPSNTARLNFPIPCLWFEQTAIIHGPTEMFACTDRPLNRSFIERLRVVANSTDCPPGDYALRIPPSNPQAANDSYVTAFETPLVVPDPGVLANDAINSGSVTSYDSISANGGSVSVNPGGGFSYSPPAGFTGTDSFGYTVTNSAGASSATVTIQVMYLPEAVDDAFTLGGSGTVDAPGVLGNDTPNSGTITAYDATTTASGSVTLNADGSFTYTAPATLPITDTFTYTLANPAGSSTATVTLTLNQAPTATDDGYSVNEDVILTVPPTGVLANDTDPDLDALTAILVAGPSNGSLTLNPDGSFVYTPDPNFNGPDTFTYQANDGFTNSNTATVTITVTPANDGPTASDQSVTTSEDTATDITLTGSDIDGDTLTFTIGTGPTNGSLGPIGAVTCAAGSCSADVTYTPALNFNGADSFTFTVSDGTATSAPATISITVSAVNDAPTANADAYSTNEDVALNISAPGVLGNDSDVEGDSLTAELVSGPSNAAAFTLNADGSFNYTPNANFSGTDSFTYMANDGQADSNVATVTITVNAVNDAPVANTQSVTTDEDSAITITLTGNDIDGDSLTFAIGISPTNGSLGSIGTPSCVAGSCTAEVIYTPDPDYSGSDSFTFTVSDGVATSAPATVNITVDPVNDPPVANDDAYDADGVTPLVIAAPGVLGNDTDTESDPLTAVLVAGPTGGTLELAADGSFTYTANSGTTSDSFTYKANDGTSDSNIATVTISVNAVPVADSQSVSTAEDTPVSITLTGSDADDEDLTFAIGIDPTLGSLGTLGAVDCSAANTCSVTVLYTPNTDANGSDSFTFTVNDGNGNSLPGTVSITITAVNDPPSFTAPDPPASLEDAGLQTVTGWVTSVSTGPANESGQTILGYTVSNVVPSATMSFTTPPAVAANGTLTYQAAPNAYGTATFDVVVQDSGGGTDTSSPQSFTITVNPVNDAPTFTAGDDVTVLEDAGPQTVNPWATSISAGPNESTQTVIFTVTNDNNALFSTQPAISPTGTLTFTTALNKNGTATVSVTLVDNGGTVDGGVDTSATVTFDIIVNPVNDAPTALAKTYNAQANMPVTIDGTTQGGGLLTGATDPDASDPGFSSVLSVGTVSATTPTGGTVSVTNSTGAFTFTPPPGVTGNVTFTYTVCDNGNPMPSLCSAAQTVTINVAGPAIWFVDPNAATNGNGTLGNPFNTLTAAAAVDAAGHRIFLYSGTANAGITLEANEWLIGQGATNSPSTFDALFGITPPAGTATRPTIGGTRPSINFTGGTAVTLSTSNRLQGFNINSQAGIFGGDVDGLLVSQLSVTSTNGSALNIAGGTSAMNVALDGVNANSGANPGVSATNNLMGTLVITGAANTITSTTGTALNISNTTIGATGVKFLSVSANGGANGIVLNTTGSSGGLTVTGDGAATANGSGGTIQNTTSDGVFLSQTINPTLTAMNINNSADSGISVDAVSGLNLSYLFMDSNGAQSEGGTIQDNGIHIEDLTGNANTISNSTIQDSRNTNLDWDPNSSAAMSTLTVTNTNLNHAGEGVSSAGNAGINLNATGTANVKLVVTGGQIINNAAAGILVTGSGTSIVRTDISGVDMISSAPPADPSGATWGNGVGTNYGISLGSSESSNQIHRINNVQIAYTGIGPNDGGLGSAISFLPTGTGSFDVTITNNTIGLVGAVRSGNENAFGIAGDIRDSVTVRADVSNNTIRNTALNGIFIQARDPAVAAGNSNVDLTVRNNTVGSISDDDDFPFGTVPGTAETHAIRIESRNDSTLRLDIAGNSADGLGGNQDYLVRQRDTSIFALERLGANSNVVATVEAFIVGQNPAPAGQTARATLASAVGFTAIADGSVQNPSLP